MHDRLLNEWFAAKPTVGTILRVEFGLDRSELAIKVAACNHVLSVKFFVTREHG